VLDVLRRVACGELTPDEAAALLRAQGVLRLGDLAALDLDRAARTGLPEVVLAEPKRPKDVARIVTALVERSGSACISRMGKAHRRAVAKAADDLGASVVAYGRRSCRVIALDAAPAPRRGLVGLISGGTSDAEVLAEARMVCEAAGCATATVADVGVAGIRRVLGPLADLLHRDVDALIVAAGMDGALPSVVAGLSPLPVIGLPVSTGYGVGGAGQAALFAMLQTCVPGLCVVNVDNGVGAGAAAALIATRRTAASSSGQERAEATTADSAAAEAQASR
jgi:NCAIR mutase (PurE)-related protein